ncbi:MAG: nucleotidyltransferase family protein, partial [Candidatus Omnitrophica bacterium]|nr:nucleotidyltransferase family protein [Candidatus Omnitrophota bacterium]
MPPEVNERFKFCCMHNIAKNQKNIHAIKDLACAFDKSGVKLVFLKGAAYLGTIYTHDAGVRLMADVDVLVKKSELEEAKKILEKEGFVQDYKRLSKEMNEELTESYFSQHHFHYVFYRDDVKLELHWDIVPSSCQTVLKKMFDSLAAVRLDTTEIYTLSPEASLF